MTYQEGHDGVVRKRTHFLTDKDVWAIRVALRSCKTQREVARAFGLSEGYISQLKSGERRMIMR